MHLVRLSGGEILAQEPRSSMPTCPLLQSKDSRTFVVYHPCTKLSSSSKTAALVPASWILESLSYFQFVEFSSIEYNNMS